MNNGWSLILDLTITIGVATLFGLALERFRQSSIVGYILAGVMIGPSVTNWIGSQSEITMLAEIGVAMLLFTIGLEFSFRKLKRLGRVAFLGGTTQVVLVLAVTAGVAMAYGKTWQSSVALGAIAALSSTAVVMRLLKDRNELDSAHGKASIGVLLLQDIAVVPLVIVVTMLGGATSKGTAKGGDPLTLLFGTAAILLGLWVTARILLPRIFDTQAFARNRDLPVLTSIGLCMAATFSAHVVGLSPALGAFLAGMMLADSDYAEQFRSDIGPLRTIFVTLFFTSIGLMVDVAFIGANLVPVLGAVLVVMLGKAILTFASLKAHLPSIFTCFATGLALSQVGELSFLLAQIGRSSGLLDAMVFQYVVAISAISLAITPMLLPHVDPISRWLCVRLFPRRMIARGERGGPKRLSNHVIVIGYGQAGQAAAAEMEGTGWPVMVLDLDQSLIREARSRGYAGQVGDAGQNENLIHANVSGALGIVIAIPDIRHSERILTLLRHLAPGVPVVVRSRYHVNARELDVLGATEVVDEEALVGKYLGRSLRWHVRPANEN